MEQLIGIRNRCFGYARVCTDDQNLSLQIDALIRFGVQPDDIFSDKMSGAKADRPGLEACLKNLKPRGTLVVWRLDRLGRSMQHLVTLVERIRGDNIGFKSITDGAIDTTTASGELIFNIFSALAQFERRLIQERTKAGLAAARARRKVGGRKPCHLIRHASCLPKSYTETSPLGSRISVRLFESQRQLFTGT